MRAESSLSRHYGDAAFEPLHTLRNDAGLGAPFRLQRACKIVSLRCESPRRRRWCFHSSHRRSVRGGNPRLGRIFSRACLAASIHGNVVANERRGWLAGRHYVRGLHGGRRTAGEFDRYRTGQDRVSGVERAQYPVLLWPLAERWFELGARFSRPCRNCARWHVHAWVTRAYGWRRGATACPNRRVLYELVHDRSVVFIPHRMVSESMELAQRLCRWVTSVKVV